MPALRAAIRDAILRELSASYGGDEIVDIRECGPRRAFSEPEEIRRSAEPPVKEEAVAETVHADENGLYLYCLADASVSTSLGCVGIDGCEVYTIPHEGVSAVVHSCPLEPYRSDDEETVKRWVKSHQQALDPVAGGIVVICCASACQFLNLPSAIHVRDPKCNRSYLFGNLQVVQCGC